MNGCPLRQGGWATAKYQIEATANDVGDANWTTAAGPGALPSPATLDMVTIPSSVGEMRYIKFSCLGIGTGGLGFGLGYFGVANDFYFETAGNLTWDGMSAYADKASAHPGSAVLEPTQRTHMPTLDVSRPTP